MNNVAVRITNTYECGRMTTSQVAVPVPEAPLEDWWEDEVHALTGDGHPCGSTENALYEAQIVWGPPGYEHLMGETYSWEG